MHMIKILTGWSNPGGSTESFIRLTNELNDKGYNTTMYGPHEWFLDKCNGGQLTQQVLDDLHADDIVLIHYLTLPTRPNVKRVVFVCHEKDIFKIDDSMCFFDICIFLNCKHKVYHREYTGLYDIIPNLNLNLCIEKNDDYKAHAGIIGSIDDNKQTHVSIKRAIEHGYKYIDIYGYISDRKYFESCVKPLIDNVNVKHHGFQNKSDIYKSIDAVFHSSISECATLVKQECHETDTKFFGNQSTNVNMTTLSNDEILDRWLNICFDMKNNGISIIIPAYNCEQYIEECLDSIYKNGYSNIEIILGIDGCKKTKEKIEKIKYKYGDILTICLMNTNNGCYVTLNTLIPLTKSENILIFGADDILKPDVLSKLANLKQPFDILRYKFMSFEHNVNNIISRSNIYANGSILIKKSVFELCGGFHHNRFSSDLELLLRVDHQTRTIFVDNSVFYYRVNHEHLTKTIPINDRAIFDNKIRSHLYNDNNIKIVPRVEQYIIL